ncbi:hypothetical protein Glove_355g15 [Diversispora epigaea]|uniref:Uncharacterized protein n=1 Tax=Diversispora epigaea TaxID=1348612 RepID=A0A397HGB0_9GLOM|nr:hypothetical protein Glove_355g15 [Diversispora epigaea]
MNASVRKENPIRVLVNCGEFNRKRRYLNSNKAKWVCKRGIFENVNAFLKRVEKGADTLTQKDLDNEENNIEEEENQSEEIETQNISNKLQIEISQIENWWVCKRGIFENVNAFLKRVEKGADTLTQKDLDNEENNIEEEENQSEEIETQNISNKLQIEISQIENW